MNISSEVLFISLCVFAVRVCESEKVAAMGFLMLDGSREQQLLIVWCPLIDACECTIGVIMFLTKIYILNA